MKALHQRLNLYGYSCLCHIVLTQVDRYIDGNETYTFVPAEPVGARSLTIYRNSGDIVLNRKYLQCRKRNRILTVFQHQTHLCLRPQNVRGRRYMGSWVW